METDDTPFKAMVGRIAPGAMLARRWPLEGGVSAHVEALEIAYPNGHTARVVLRRHGASDWKPLETDVTVTEHELLKTLAQQGFPVPAPRLLDTSGTLFPTPYMVMDFVDGSSDVSPEALPGTLEEMARFLARLHALDIGTIGLPDLPRRNDPTENTMRYLPDTSLGERIRAAHEAHGPIVSTNPPALLHGDYWPGNLLWRDDTLVGVTDWEDATLGDPMFDLAAARLELYWASDGDAVRELTERYLARTGIEEPVDLPFWDLTAALDPILNLHTWGHPPDVEAMMRRKLVGFIDDALARLGPAFEALVLMYPEHGHAVG